jgi:hypothetical protein
VKRDELKATLDQYVAERVLQSENKIIQKLGKLLKRRQQSQSLEQSICSLLYFKGEREIYK